MRSVDEALSSGPRAYPACRACGSAPGGSAGLCWACTDEANAWLEWLDTHSECQSLCMDDPTDRARMAVLLVVAEPLGGDHE